MENERVTIRFDEFSLRDKYSLRRIEGTVVARSMMHLIDVADLKADPREAKVGDVTDEIEETLKTTPQLYHFKSKGILVAAANCIPRERKRFELTFDDKDIEGILDGGHNLLAIALHILKVALGADRAKVVLRGVKRWEQVPEIWRAHRNQIDDIKDELDFLTPLEVIYPQEGAEGRDEFEDAVLDVARARNNNAQLTEETKANKAGFYEAIRASIDDQLVDQVEWKTNDGGRIKVRDLVALSWIPLSKIEEDLPGKRDFSPVAMYRNKGACVSWYNKLMESDDISKKTKGDIRELTHKGVRSALSLMKDIPRLFDLIYSEFPKAYNQVSPGFGRINSVRIWDASKTHSGDPKFLPNQPRTKFYGTGCDFDFPEGFVTPVVWALSALMEYKEGKVLWKHGHDPAKFIKKNLSKTLEVYHGMIHMGGYDPQKVGKTLGCYNLVANDFKSRLAD